MFLFPAKGEESDVIPGLVISGIITVEAAGTSGKQYLTITKPVLVLLIISGAALVVFPVPAPHA